MNRNKFYYFFLFSLGTVMLQSQSISWEELSPMPEKVTNNSVTTATVNGIPYVYSFSGIDSTKGCGQSHLNAFRYNTQDDMWESIEPLPDPLGGKIAAGASTVKNKIYIIGGYHVSNSCGEISSAKTHIYDPESNQYLLNGANLPKAIDDHVQAVWRDSLIYVISGWSNINNVTDVQIYNPGADEWINGTAVPGSSQWRVFGASGTIIGDTIYFAGGAGNWNGSNFPPTTSFRKGYIDPNNPSNITWESATDALSRGYRMGASDFDGKAIWIGGADVTYNFDGISYNGSGGVPPLDRVTIYRPEEGALSQIFGFIPKIMDMRGIAKISDNEFIIAGGMLENQAVSNKTFKIQIDNLTSIEEAYFSKIKVFPNPASDFINIDLESPFEVEIIGMDGKKFLNLTMSDSENVDVSALPTGIYFLKIEKDKEVFRYQKLLVH